MTKSRLQLPPGASCFSFAEARRRRALEALVVRVFEGWGYAEIVPPLFDDASAFDSSLTPMLYTFTGRDGSTLALRPDFTTLVAKIAAGSLRKVEAPMRLYYSGEVVRYEAPRAGRQNEFHQMGIEFLGGGGPVADTEAIAIAIECLEAIGARDFVVALGHAGLVAALLEAAKLTRDDPRREATLRSLSRRDPRGVGDAIDGLPAPKGVRHALIGLAEDTGIRQSLQAARHAVKGIEAAEGAIGDLEATYRALDEADLGQRIAIDLSESRGLDYYTGLVFRVYAEGLGVDLGGGGRYDHLLGTLGRPMNAVGFMLGLDRLSALSGGQSEDTKAGERPASTGIREETIGASLRKAREYRRRGQTIRFEGPE